MGRRRRARIEPQPQRLADLDVFFDRDVRAEGRIPDGGLALTEASRLLSADAALQPGGGLYRYQNAGKHRRAIEQRYGNNE